MVLVFLNHLNVTGSLDPGFDICCAEDGTHVDFRSLSCMTVKLHDSVASKDNKEPKRKTLLRNEQQTEVISRPKVTSHVPDLR